MPSSRSDAEAAARKPGPNGRRDGDCELIQEALGRLERAGNLSLTDTIRLGASMSETLAAFMRVTEQAINAEFREIANAIQAMKVDIAGLRANELQHTHLPTAERELDAVVTATEDATNLIMESAEAIIAADASDPAAYKELVDSHVMRIFEACSFQDITGQRISKVVETLKIIDERVGRLAGRLKVEDAEGPASEAEAERAKRRDELLLNGPAAAGEAIAQDAVDALFTNA